MTKKDLEFEDLPEIDLRHFFWRQADISYKLDSLQKKIREVIYDTPSDEILILSSRQIGKSFTATCLALEWCLAHPHIIVRILAPTLKQVEDIVADNLGPILEDMPDGLVTRHKSSYRWQVGKSSLRLGALERAHVDNNRGGNASLIILEEGGFVSSDDYDYALKSVISPQLLRSGGRLLHVTSPSEDPGHIIHTEILPKCQLNETAFRYTIHDSPQITPDLLEKAIKRVGGVHTSAWRREYLAEIIRAEETVIIPHFRKDLHVKEFEIPEQSFWQISIDFGGVRDKTVALLYTYDFKRNKILWRSERVFDQNTSTTTIIAKIREMEKGLEISARFADCPGQLQIDLASIHGYEIQLPVKDDWRAGINSLQVSFGSGQHEIHPDCRFLIQSLESGRFNKQHTDFERNSVLGHCDAIAAMSYGNRMLNLENPYPYIHPPRDTTFRQRPHVEPMEVVVNTLQPKTFANTFENDYFDTKQFGTFKR